APWAAFGATHDEMRRNVPWPRASEGRTWAGAAKGVGASQGELCPTPVSTLDLIRGGPRGRKASRPCSAQIVFDVERGAVLLPRRLGHSHQIEKDRTIRQYYPQSAEFIPKESRRARIACFAFRAPRK